MFNQGRRSTNEAGTRCVYRGRENTRCVVGCLIPDEMYTEEFEGMSVFNLVARFNEVVPSYFSDNVHLLTQLQATHDLQFNWRSPEYLADSLRRVAACHLLDTSILDELTKKYHWSNKQTVY